jgi:UDP-N-acetylmuramoyl-L-alanyl-D-glutamate--2,6-diaminopimelate ligase
MKLAALAAALAPDVPLRLMGSGEIEVRAITADSRAVAPGVVFAALPGTRTDGRRFIADALARGAVAVLAPEETVLPAGARDVPLLVSAAPRRAYALAAAALAGHRQPEVAVAITGTNGKTSTVSFLRQLWSGLGHRAASLGTLGLEAPGMAPRPSLTTPDPAALWEALGTLAAAGVSHLALEASSHGLDQCRLDGLRLAAGAITNLTRDHLDYHGTFDAYRSAKLRLFAELLPEGAVAAEQPGLEAETAAALAAIAKRRRLRLIAIGEREVGIAACTPRPEGQALVIRAFGRREEVLLPLAGRFQAENAVLAATLAEALGAPPAVWAGLARLAGVRGRLEHVGRTGRGGAVYVDYAHTPDALARVLEALREHTEGRLFVVFGAGGDRDPGKRPEMGRVAARLADRVIVTDDNPRHEDPAAIRRAILAGCPGAREIGDRREAIAAALDELGPGDVLVVAGKGHEQGQIIGDTVLPFDDAAVIRELLGAAAGEGGRDAVARR